MAVNKLRLKKKLMFRGQHDKPLTLFIVVTIINKKTVQEKSFRALASGQKFHLMFVRAEEGTEACIH